MRSGPHRERRVHLPRIAIADSATFLPVLGSSDRQHEPRAAGFRFLSLDHQLQPVRRKPRAACQDRHPGVVDIDAVDDQQRTPEHTELRAPQSGLVMLRGRIGGDGAPFNFGEAREQGRAEFDKCVLAPIRARLKAERERAAQHVAATKVEFLRWFAARARA